MDYFEKVLSIANRAQGIGERTLPNGTRLVGAVPHVAPEAWLHQIFAPLKAADILDAESKIKKTVPSVFASFLKKANGLNLFSCSLSIYGIRSNFSRTGDAVWQPFSLITLNTIERPKDAADSFFFVGGYSWDGSHLYIDSKTLRVFRSKRRTAAPLNEWKNFEDMLVEETIRVALLYDDGGRRLSPQSPTTPDSE